MDPVEQQKAGAAPALAVALRDARATSDAVQHGMKSKTPPSTRSPPPLRQNRQLEGAAPDVVRLDPRYCRVGASPAPRRGSSRGRPRRRTRADGAHLFGRLLWPSSGRALARSRRRGATNKQLPSASTALRMAAPRVGDQRRRRPRARFEKASSRRCIKPCLPRSPWQPSTLMNVHVWQVHCCA